MNIKKIHQYEIVKEIGKGGMGVVYLCRDTEMDRMVAIKVLKKNAKTKVSKVAESRFIKEALITSRLQHPGIPPVFNVGKTEDNRPYYAMKLIEGTPLDVILSKLKNNKQTNDNFNIQRLVEIIIDLGQTLSYAHSQNYIHRDLKPSNIFIGDYGEVYLIDWGLTKKIDSFENATNQSQKEKISEDTKIIEILENKVCADDDASLTLDGDILGTPAYMSPEQIKGSKKNVSFSADIYALGAILYQMLSFKHPFFGMSVKEILLAKKKGVIKDPNTASPERDIPPELAAIAMQAMQHEPINRMKSVKDFCQACSFWLKGSTQFRNNLYKDLSNQKFSSLPSNTKNRWVLKDNIIKTVSQGKGKTSLLYFQKPFFGDISIELNMRIISNDQTSLNMPRFGLVFKASDPIQLEKGPHYALFFAGDNNTKLSLTRNETEIRSNEHTVLEPNQKYHIQLICRQGEIHVKLNGRTILYCVDRSPLSGEHFGFVHQGQSVIYSNIQIQTRGLPLKTNTIDIPETLLAERCFDSARRRFLDIYRNHKNRYIGNWAVYRAGIAAWLNTKNINDALKVWNILNDSRYRELKSLGLARVELIKGNPSEAAHYLNSILQHDLPAILLRSVADFTQNHMQNLLRPEAPYVSTETIEKWIRLSLQFDQRLDRRDSATLSFMRNWIYRTATDKPHQIKNMVVFLKETAMGLNSNFSQLILNEKFLPLLFKRSLSLQNHSFLMDKLMRLILWHENPLEDLETLGRFYLNSGHFKIASQIFSQLIKTCLDKKIKIPPATISYVVCYQWLNEDYTSARKNIKIMIKHANGWGPTDGQFFLGLDDYRQGKRLNAIKVWGNVRLMSKDKNDIRAFITEGLLGHRPPNPDEAKIPLRSDYRLLFCLFTGLRYYTDWQQHKSEQSKQQAIFLLLQVQNFIRPSYDIYVSTSLFSRIPLENMGVQLEPMKIEILNKDEKNWLKELILALSEEINS